MNEETKYIQRDEAPSIDGPQCEITVDADPDTMIVMLKFDLPVKSAGMSPENGIVLSQILLDKSILASGVRRAVNCWTSDEVMWQRGAAEERAKNNPDGKIGTDPEFGINFDMGHWTLRVEFGMRGLADVQRQLDATIAKERF